MCGFAFSKIGDSVPSMLSTMERRGLNKTRQHTLHTAVGSFGHVRLPIQGLSHEFDQPFKYKNWIFLFVGEIFNYKELMPNAKSDVEVLCQMWDNFGYSCLRLFDGFWSIFVYDRDKKEFWVATDVLSKKPIYCHTPTMSFASEIKALIQFGVTDNLLYYSQVAKWGYSTTNGPYNEIGRLTEGTVSHFDENMNTLEIIRWSELRPKADLNIRKAIEKSVNNRLVSDVPLSLLLSGGLDSSIIYKLIEKKTHNFTIFHVDNEESEFLNYLNIPGDIPVKKLVYDKVDVSEALFANEGPVDLGSMLPQFALCEAIRKECPDVYVTLTGDGADEIAGGYRRQREYDAQYSDIYDELVHYHLPRLDKMSMYHTLELRSPFLATPVIEGFLSVPYKERIDKKHLKNLFLDIIPKAIIERPKLPLKSKQVLQDANWRFDLIKKFKNEVQYEYNRIN